jgi:lysophospholipase
MHEGSRVTTSKKYDAPAGWHFDSFRSDSGHLIRYGFVAPPGKSKGTVVVTGGYGRHIEYYYEMINNWRDRGYSVYAMDWYGMGGSEREDKAHPHRPPTAPFVQQARLLHEFTQNIVRPDPQNPAFLVSHSMGAHNVLRYLRLYERRPDFPYSGAILATPLIDINTAMVPRRLFNRLVKAANNIGWDEMPMPSARKFYNDFIEAMMFGKDAADPERDTAHERHRRETHDMHIGYPTAGWFAAALESIRVVRHPAFLEQIQTPILMITAEKDSLVSVKAQEEAALHLPHAALIKLRGAKHGLWYDCDRIQAQLWNAVDTFAAGLCARHAPRAHFAVRQIKAAPEIRPL